jgi:leader peptidase (prepilin peptidase) / N-methyltransferase
MHHLPWILFVFALGACVGSFLNVVVWRLPRGESLSHPPSHCPKCNARLWWRDNLPIIGWLKLRGRCRFCRAPISPRYPIVEAFTGLLFVFYYVMFFVFQVGPCAPQPPVMTFYDPYGGGGTLSIQTPRALTIWDDWAMYGLFMALVASLLAASLIDAEEFIIPLEIPWFLAGLGVVAHAILDTPRTPGALTATPPVAALAAGGGVGLLISFLLWKRGILPTSFPEGEVLDIDRAEEKSEREAAEKEGRRPAEEDVPLPPPPTRAEMRREIGKEMLFLLPPMVLAAAWWGLTSGVDPIGRWWAGVASPHWVSGLLGAVFGGLIGGFVVWITRILGSLGFGRVAMGLGDVHLMVGVGAIIGAGASTVAFFVAPFFGIAFALYKMIARTGRELPYGPFLSMAAAAMLLFYCQIAARLAPGMEGLAWFIQSVFGAGGAPGGGGA